LQGEHGRSVPLEAAALIDVAQTRAGLTDFGDSEFTTPLSALVASFRNDAWPLMSPQVREKAIEELVGLLVNRLKVTADRDRHPGIRKGSIERPLIVVGPARSGTSLLHTLLAQDPENRSVLYWHSADPSPPPGLAEPTRERLGTAIATLTSLMAADSRIEVMHSYYAEEGVRATEECSSFMPMAFTTNRFWYFYPLPGYHDYLLTADHAAAMRFHRSFLQHVQFPATTARWALKSPDHMYWLRELADEYPEAGFVWTHRDLAQLSSSVTSSTCLTRTLTGMLPATGRRALGQDSMKVQREILDKGMRGRDAVGEDRFCDVSYHDVLADPVETVRRIYRRFGRTLSESAAVAIRAWVDGNNQTKHGVHQHAPDDFGFDRDEINTQFAEYRDRFGFGYGVRRSFE